MYQKVHAATARKYFCQVVFLFYGAYIVFSEYEYMYLRVLSRLGESDGSDNLQSESTARPTPNNIQPLLTSLI